MGVIFVKSDLAILDNIIRCLVCYKLSIQQYIFPCCVLSIDSVMLTHMCRVLKYVFNVIGSVGITLFIKEEIYMAKKLCSICYAPFSEWGNNAEPVNSGTCCDLCNDTVVIPARINRMTHNAV